MGGRSIAGLVGLFVVTTIVTLIARFPLALALVIADAPLQAERVTGTIWNGRIENAWIAGYPVGHIDVSAAFWPLLTGKAAADIAVQGPMLQGQGKVSVARQRAAMREAAFAINLSALGVPTAFGPPLDGRVDVQVRDLQLVGTECRSADVSLATDALHRAVQPYGLDGMMLAGEGRCADGVFNLPLAGESADGRAEIDLRVAASGYMTELALTPTDPRIGRLLVDVGFQADRGTYRLIERGEVIP